MSRVWIAVAATLWMAAPAIAADAEFFEPPKRGGLELEALARQEWTRKIFVSPVETRDEDRWRLQLRPRITAGGDQFRIGIGGEFNRSSDENVDLDPPPTLVR